MPEIDEYREREAEEGEEGKEGGGGDGGDISTLDTGGTMVPTSSGTMIAGDSVVCFTITSSFPPTAHPYRTICSFCYDGAHATLLCMMAIGFQWFRYYDSCRSWKENW
jgi:hypothetical protein